MKLVAAKCSVAARARWLIASLTRCAYAPRVCLTARARWELTPVACEPNAVRRLPLAPPLTNWLGSSIALSLMGRSTPISARKNTKPSIEKTSSNLCKKGLVTWAFNLLTCIRLAYEFLRRVARNLSTNSLSPGFQSQAWAGISQRFQRKSICATEAKLIDLRSLVLAYPFFEIC